MYIILDSSVRNISRIKTNPYHVGASIFLDDESKMRTKLVQTFDDVPRSDCLSRAGETC